MFYSPKYVFLIIGIVLFFKTTTLWALAPIESLVLGNFSEKYSENENDPLNYVFSFDKNIKIENIARKKDLALYRGFYEEGRNTLNYCKDRREIQYATDWQKTQVMRSMLSEVQYIGLDLMSRAIPQYAKALEFSKEEYNNLIEGLVGNFCSANLSVISKKELKNNLLVKFDRENTYRLPSVEGNPFFPESIEKVSATGRGIQQEFKFTIKLFQSICSWGGDPYNPALLVPILKNPSLMAFFIRQLSNREIDWEEKDNSLFLKQGKNTVQVWCENLICRKTSPDLYMSKVYFSVGGTSIAEDLQRLFCEEFKNIDYKSNYEDERISKIIKSRTFDEENFINSQFIALITGVPDFLLRAEKFSNGEDILRSNIDYTWSKWAKKQSEVLDRELYFEEPLSIELIERKLYFNPKKPELKVAFDVNLGEFDRINQRIGKVRVSFNVNFQKKFLNYYYELFKNKVAIDSTEREKIVRHFKAQISQDVNEARKKFIIAPWKGDLEGLIVNEIIEQLQLIENENYKMGNDGSQKINIELNYGTFALKYLNNQKTVQDSRAKNADLLSK